MKSSLSREGEIMLNRNIRLLAIVAAVLTCGSITRASVIEFGDEDVLGTGTYPSDPKAGAMLEGLAANVVTDSSLTVGHGYPFTPSAGDFASTDQIYVGSNQSGAHDGYSVAAQLIKGPQVAVLDYSSLVPAGQTVSTLTLGIAADDFQFPVYGQPFTAEINGVLAPALTDKLNSMDESGPVVHFFTIGVDPSLLTPDNLLTLSIDDGGDGGDGWAADFYTVGVTTSVPAPSSLYGAVAFLGICGMTRMTQRRKSV
jgi:hypothetical protein